MFVVILSNVTKESNYLEDYDCTENYKIQHASQERLPSLIKTYIISFIVLVNSNYRCNENLRLNKVGVHRIYYITLLV